LGFSNFTTEDYDYGYDAKMFETKTEDMFTMWKGHDMIAQAYPSIHPTNKIPLGLNVTGNHTYKIKATAFDNFKANQNVYLHDKLTNTYFDLRSKEAYGFTSERGRIEDRFEIVFKANQAKKDLEVIIDNTLIYYNTTSDKLFVKGLEANAEQLTVVNMLGQAVMTQKEVSKEALNQGIHISDLSTGVYIVQITTGDLQNIEKKIIID
ncbi:MAG: T9SS type A sorting domain-containing protein, partial [Winogradskyella sp.]|nr:T9SS type A sorting domain-containing protein [Winogradskyella sp.]